MGAGWCLFVRLAQTAGGIAYLPAVSTQVITRRASDSDPESFAPGSAAVGARAVAAAVESQLGIRLDAASHLFLGEPIRSYGSYKVGRRVVVGACGGAACGGEAYGGRRVVGRQEAHGAATGLGEGGRSGSRGVRGGGGGDRTGVLGEKHWARTWKAHGEGTVGLRMGIGGHVTYRLPAFHPQTACQTHAWPLAWAASWWAQPHRF